MRKHLPTDSLALLTTDPKPLQDKNHQLIGSQILGILLILLIGIPLMSNSTLKAQCVSGPSSGDITGNASSGPPINWANPNRVEISDDLWARATMDAGDTSKYLEVTDFGMTIPGGATVVGIQAFIEKHQEVGADARDASIRLMKAGTRVGHDPTSPFVWPDNDMVSSYGGPNSLWGETWTPADINDIGFGISFSATRLTGPNNMDVHIDYIGLIVYYVNGPGCMLSAVMTQVQVTNNGDGSAGVSWSTEMESQNDYFTIERAKDGSNFSPLGTVSGAGNSETTLHYEFQDMEPMSGVSFYRIKQTDMDGQSSYSYVVQTTFETTSSTILSAFPNPASDVLNVELSESHSNTTLELRDLSGRLVKQKIMESNELLTQFDVSDLSPGLYLLCKPDQGSAATRKIIVR